MGSNLEGQALVAARRRKGWTQVQLSEATRPRVVVSTISRLEGRKASFVRRSTLAVLAKALDVAPDSLCSTPQEQERDAVKLRMTPGGRNALALVSARYGINRDHIVEWAPLLFFIVAEQSLRERSRRVMQIRAAASFLREIGRDFTHMPIDSTVNEEAIALEESAISKRDLFGGANQNGSQEWLGQQDEDDDQLERESPMSTLLRDALAEIAEPAAADSLTWAPGCPPRYEICRQEAGSHLGDDDHAANAVLQGTVGLHEIPRGLSPSERGAWVRAEIDRRMSDVIESLGLRSADSASLTAS